MTQRSPHFNDSEFKCKCCGKLPSNGMDRKLIDLLEEIRTGIDKPIIIVSGYRCEKHNKKCGGVPKSQHVQGTAADIKVVGMNPDDVQHWLVKHVNSKCGGIGCYTNFTHVDVREGMARWNERNKQ